MELIKAAKVEGDRRRVVIIEDDPFWQYQLRHNLKAIDADLEIRVMGSAEEFLDGAERNYDLIISDQNLGFGRSGLSVWRSLQGTHPEIPFALTSGTGDQIFDELTIAGLTERPVFIEKPYRFQNFKAQVEAMLAARVTAVAADEPLAVDWGALFSGMMFLSAVASLLTVGLHMEMFQDGGAQMIPASPRAFETLQKGAEAKGSAFVSPETARRMHAILARADKINHIK